MKFNFGSLISLFPFIPISWRHGGTPIAWASLRGLNTLVLFAILVCCVGGFFFFRWYGKHPLLGKIILILLVLWVIWKGISWLVALGDDPLTRQKPYRPVDLPEEKTAQREER